MFTKTKFFTYLLLVVVLDVTAQPTAQDTTTLLGETVVTYPIHAKTPVTFQIIRNTDLEARSIGQEPSFWLAETPAITNYSDAGSTQGYSYWRMRGIDQTRINITLDGMPLNEPEDQGAYFSNYPDLFNSISQLQIQRGVGTSQNGTASYAGSLQLFSPSLYDTARFQVGAGYGSFNSLRAFAEYASGRKKQTAIYARASEIYSDGYKYRSANHSQSVFLSGGWMGGRSTLKINALAGRQRNQLAWLGVRDSLIEVDRRTNANSNERDRFDQYLTQLQHHWAKRHHEIRSSVYATFLDGNYDFDLNNFLGLPLTDELYNYAFRSRLWGMFSNYTWSKNEINATVGAHANRYARQHTGSEKQLGQLYQNTGYKNEASLFAKADYSLGRLNLFGDVQYRYVTFDYTGGVPLNTLTWAFLNPKLGLSFGLLDHLTAYYSVGSTGREPTRNDLFGGNDDLLADSLGQALIFIQTPEYVVDHELGIRFKNARLRFDANLYFMDFRNEIVLNGKFGPNGLALTNSVAQSIRTGLEWSLAYQINPKWAFNQSAAFNYSRIKTQTVTFSPILTPAILLHQEVAYQTRRLVLALSARYQSQSYIDFSNTATVGQYALLNARVGYSKGRLGVQLFLNNLTNTRYYNHGYVDFDQTRKYFVQAPFNAHLAATYRF